MEFIPNEYGYARFTGNVKKVDSYTMTAEDSTDSSDVWEHTFDNLDMYRDGKLIYYGVGEEDVPSLDEADEAQYYFSTIKIDSSGSVVYKTDIDEKNEYIFVSELVSSFRVSSSIHEKYYSWALAFGNNYTPESLDISGKKTWIDADNKDDSRPDSVKVYLMKNGEDFQTYEMSEATGWTYEFPDLYKYEDGEEIEYTIEEEEVPGYTTEYETTVDDENNTITTDITNTYVRDIPVTKTWNDADDQDGKRPESVTVRLLADNKEYGTYDLNEANDWTYTFTDLPKFNTRGTEIAYTIEEVSVADYTTRITGSAADGYTITNSHTPEKLDIKGKKIWDDAFDQDGKRQGFVTVRLLKDNEEFKKVTVTEEDNWSYSFLDLDKYENGREIEYSISETPVQDYTKELIPTADGYDLKNTHTPETVDITVEKTWDDADDQDGFRPESIKVNLLADNVKVDQAEVRPDAAGKWAYTFSDKPKYNNGIEIAYTVSEEAVDKYRASQDGLKITNIHTPETVDISGTKTWVDGDDQDGIRPAYVTVKLLADGAEVRKQTITDDDDWKYEFKDMPKYKDGKEIVYTLDEVAVVGYTVTKDGYNLTNTHTPETTEFEVSKVWDDAFDKDGLRPDSVELTLYADDKEAGKIELNEDNDWSYKWTGLPKYAEGTEITYTVEEAPVTGYTTVIEGGTITNTHIPAPELIDIPVTKVWSDNGDNDGKRPESVTVNLLADGELCETYELKAEEGWKHTFADLAKFNEDKEINYTIEEITSDDYSCTISGNAKDGFTITNTHTPETGSVFAFKVWDDNNNKDGKRPDSITLQLLGDGDPVEGQEDKVIAKDADNTMVSWTDLPVYKDGKEIEYTVVEAGVTDGRLGEYEVDVTETIIGFVITNRISEETVDVKATKVWDDDNDRDRKRPAEVSFLLYADGVPTGDTKKVTAETPSVTWTDLPKNKDGAVNVPVNYEVKEEQSKALTDAKYTQNTSGDALNGFIITNSRTTDKTEVPVTKIWSDADDQDGKRPESVTVLLKADGETVGSRELTEDSGWQFTWTGLNKYKDGKEIEYTVDEAAVAGYTKSISGTTITNTYTPETVDLTVEKAWSDSDDQDGKRPSSVTAKLLADGKEVASQALSAANGWKYTFTGLPKFNSGKEIVYTVAEDPVAGYEADIDGLKITNVHQAETTEVKATKVWNDDNNRDGKRDDVTLQLQADGQVLLGSDKLIAKNASDTTVSWTDLPKYNDGKEITYSVVEAGVVDNKLGDYAVQITGDAESGFTVTNSYTPEKLDISGVKTWNDNNDQDKKRPGSIKVNLKKNGVVIDSKTVGSVDNWKYEFNSLYKYEDGKQVTYEITEEPVSGYAATVTGYDVTNTYTPETTKITVIKTWDDEDDQDGIRPESVNVTLTGNDKEAGTAVLSAGNNWTYSWDNLPKKENGTDISYTVTEAQVSGYTAEISEKSTDLFEIINKHVPETTEVKATKVWNDDNNRDGKRTDVTLQLQADGQVIAGQDKTIAKDAADTTVVWTDLPKYNDGKEITYSVVEAGVVDNKLGDYAVQITGDAESGFTVTNSYTPEKLDISGVKTWNDDNDRDKKRPDNIMINLLANGKVVDSTTLDATGSGNYEFKDLPKFENGTEITYAVTEDPVDGYATTVDGYNITNTYTTEKTKITVIKKWDDAGNQDAKRPDSVNVAVRGNGGLAGTAVLSAENNWSYTWDNLPKKENGEDISYTVAETEPEGYTAEVNEAAEGVFEITNKYTPETVEIKATKVWSDDNNRDGKRTDVTFQLQADGQVISGQDKTIAKDAADTTVAWTDLPKYDDGKEIAYSVVEAGVIGDKLGDYSVSITGDANTGFTITNSYTPETVTVSGTKTWDDDSDRDGIRPASVTVDLLKNGEKTDSAIVDEASGWKYEFKNLPKYEAGEEITYTVSETVTGAYNPDISGYDITNRYTPETTQVTVTKEWNDASDQDGKRPDKINVSLTADGVDTGKTAELSEKNGWTFTWLGLPAKENGRYIVYDVAESETVTGYTSVKTGDAKAGFTLTNSYTPETVDVSGVKTWNDDDNRDGLRPEYITVNLLKNGKVSDTKTVTAANGWSYEWTGLPKYERGTEITYTVTEEAVADYTSVISGYNVTNSYTPETTGVTVVKVWNDEDDVDGLRPAAVTVALRGNGGLVGSAELSAENNWTYTWTSLPKKENGADISYAVVEAAVEGYESEVTGSASSAFVITNTHEHKEEEPVYVQVPVSKKDATTSEELPGAVLTIKNSEGAIVANWISGTEPEVVILEPGTYTLIEDKAPLGYAGEESITFTVTATGVEGGPVEMRDEPLVVNISKQAVGGGSELAGASLAVKGLSNDFAESWVSGETAHVIERIPAGVYMLTETQAPEGYEIAETIVFRVNEDNTVECLDGEVWSVVTDNTVIMLDALKPDEPVTHEIEISKKDAASKEELPGAQLTVTDSEGNELYSWTSTNEARKITLKPGTYTLTEVTAPDWYEKAESITFTVDENGLVDSDKVEMINAAQKVYDRFSVNVILAKDWTDADGKAIAWPEGSEVEFVLQYKDSKGNWADYTDDQGNPYTVKLNAELTEYVFEELPAVINGEVAQYRAVELTEVEGFKKAVSESTDLAARLGRMEAVNVQEKGTEPDNKPDGSEDQSTDNKEETNKPGNDGKDVNTDTTDNKETETTDTKETETTDTKETETTDTTNKKTTGTGTESGTKTSASGTRRTATSAATGTAARSEAVTSGATTAATSTGDSDNTDLWIVLAAAAAVSLAGVGFAMRRRKYNR